MQARSCSALPVGIATGRLLSLQVAGSRRSRRCSARFDPRPEVLSLLGVAAFLAILVQSERRVALVWVLPLIQLIWVNAHALFVLGPIILARTGPNAPVAHSWKHAPLDSPAGGRGFTWEERRSPLWLRAW